MEGDAILVLDFGGQYCHLIARRIRENHVRSEIVSHDTSVHEVEKWQQKTRVKGLVLSGGPQSVFAPNALGITTGILDLNIPILGLCYGHQLLAHVTGGLVRTARKREFGVAVATIDKPVGVLQGLDSRQKVWMSHSDTVCALSDEFEVLAHTANSPIAAFRHRKLPIYGLQWHPEVVHTQNGDKMLKSFLFEVCNCHPNWTMENFIDKAVEETRSIVGEAKAIVALSGGIDSSTVTAIAARAIGKNLTAVFVDHGFMRLHETQFVMETFQDLDVNLVCVDAKRRFMTKLKGVKNPESKRKTIGEEFIRVFEEEAEKVGAEYLLQGTIYPDRIESGFQRFSEKIKTHHNVAGLPTRMEFKAIVEPLRNLYKDEVREVAKKLGLPDQIVERQPFPGPGLAVRIVGELTQEKVEIARKADQIVVEEIQSAGLRNRLWQYFAVLTDTKTTGVKGDAGAYGATIVVRVVESKEAMTASFARIPYETLEAISSRITNELTTITRVVYDITNKPPATIEWE